MEALIEKTDSISPEFMKLHDELKTTVKEKGFVQVDNRMNRMTQSLPGHFVVVSNPKLLEWLDKQEVLGKYRDDSKRMYTSFKRVVKEVRKDPNSRQLMVFNDSKFNEVNECFTHFQFVYTHRNEFDLYVYQRSADIVKLKDDLVFFAHQMKKLEKLTHYYVTKLVVVYGHVHYEISK